MRENPTPSEGVQGRFTAKVALWCLYRGWSSPTPSEGVGKCGETRLLRKESENAMKRDSLGRSAVWIYGENGYWRVACDPGGIFADSHIDYH